MRREALLAPRAERLIAQQPLPHDVSIRVGDAAFRVRTNSAPLRERLAAYWRGWLAPADGADVVDVAAIDGPSPRIDEPLTPHPPGPGKARVKDEYVDFADGRLLRKRLTGLVYCFGDVPSVVAGPCLANDNQVVNFVNNRCIQHHLDRGWLLCHAAGAARGGRGLLLAGMSGRGKSTLALHLLGEGFDYISNDRLLVKCGGDGVQMVGVAKLPRVNPGTILNNPRLAGMLSDAQRAEWSVMPAGELWGLERKFDVDVQACFGGCAIRASAPLVGAVLLTWKRGGGPMTARPARLAERADLLEALMKTPGAHYFRRAAAGGGVDEAAAPGPDWSAGRYVEMFAAARLVELSGGVDFAAAAAECARFAAPA